MSTRDGSDASCSAEEIALVHALFGKGEGRHTRQPAIEPRRSGDLLPLSFAQQRLWFLHQWNPGAATYNCPFAIRVSGALRSDVLQATLTEIVRRHEILRTRLVTVDGIPRQEVLPPSPLPLVAEDLTGLPDAIRQETADRSVHGAACAPFDLEQGSPIRARLLSLAADEHILVLVLHHIVSDAWSVGILVHEIGALYESFLDGKPSPLPELDVQYADYALWQRHCLTADVLRRQVTYWRRQLANAPALLRLPTDRPRPAVQSFRGARVPVAIRADVLARLRELGVRRAATVYMVVLAGFQTMLSRYGGGTDVLVATPVAGRMSDQVAGMIGFFVNTLPIRGDLSGNPAFSELVDRVRDVTLEALAHQELPFEMLVEELQPERSLSHAPICQVCMVLQTVPLPVARVADLSLQPIDVATATSKFDMTLFLSERDGALTGSLEYSTDLFDRRTAEGMANTLSDLLGAASEAHGTRLADLPARNGFGDPLAPAALAPPSRTFGVSHPLPALFQQRAAQTPDAVAVTAEGEQLTYRAVDERSNRLAQHLRRLGIGTESRVGVCFDRSPQIVAAILGVLKAGAAYVPLDPRSPSERLGWMLDDAQCQIVISETSLAASLSESGRRVIVLDADWSEVAKEPDETPAIPLHPDNAAYIIYTSGSTGRPKGVVVSHANVVRLFAATESVFRFTSLDVWTLFHSCAFDFSVWELWGALLHGGRLVLVPYLVSRSPETFYELVRQEGVTVLNQTPSAFRQFARADEEAEHNPDLALRYVVFGGEALDLSSLKGWYERHPEDVPRLVNMYGITETTVHVTCRLLRKDDLVSTHGSAIGLPIADLSLHLLDERLRPVPAGGVGEICVGGAGLARGYLDSPELTAARFTPDPFAAVPGSRLYRSGDLGRQTSGGLDIEYLGRADHQVKIRGFRIEPGEVQTVLSAHQAVREAVVIAVDDGSSERRLAAYVVFRSAVDRPVEELRAFLAARLPDYMIPSTFVLLDRLPLTPNGKIDRTALPMPPTERPNTAAAYAPAATTTEQILVEIWQGVLGLSRVGIDDNYFALGGDSIRSVRVLALAKQRGLSFSLQELFELQTVRELGRVAGMRHGGQDTPPARAAPIDRLSLISPADRLRVPDGVVDVYPMTALQSGMIFHLELAGRRPTFHNLNSWPLKFAFEPDLFDAAVNAVVGRHDALRTSFDWTTFSEPMQMVHASVRLPVAHQDLRGLPTGEQQRVITEYVTAQRALRFDLTRPPLLRLSIHRLEDEVVQFTLTECHAIFDGWSLQSTLAEIFQCYDALRQGQPLVEPGPLRSSAREFVRLEREAIASEASRSFWTRTLADHRPLRLVRRGGTPPSTAPEKGHRRRVRVDPQITRGLSEVAERAGVPLKAVLLAAHVRVLGLLGGATDIVTGLVSNGRPEVPDGDRIRGLFLNTVPFRLRIGGGTFLDLARDAFRAECELLPHRRYPLSEIQKAWGQTPIFDTSFNFTHFHVLEGVLTAGAVEALPGEDRGIEETNFALDASFSVSPLTRQLTLTIDCDPRELGDAYVDLAATSYERVLRAIACSPTSDVLADDLLTLEERARTLVAWNSTMRDESAPATVHELFQQQAIETPMSLAVSCGGTTLTYRELDQRAASLAQHLAAIGVRPEFRVGVLIDRSIELAIGVLGILKAGAAYVPMDTAYPPERLAYMLADAKCSMVLTTRQLGHRCGHQAARMVYLEEPWGVRPGELSNAVPVDSMNAAYVMYTSGSTSRPKGVIVPHGALRNYMLWLRAAYPHGPADRALQYSPISFDASLIELFLPLISGGRLVFAEPNPHQDAISVVEAIQREGITTLQVVPTMLRILLDCSGFASCQSLRRVFCSGEPLTADLSARFHAQLPIELINVYGPTETCLDATFATCGVGADVNPIGRPIANVATYVLNPSKLPVPPGVPGELYIGGAGVARGYHNQIGLTAEKFLPDPFSGRSGARLYRTGDLARHLPDGTLEYLGRNDDQMKIRGVRTEPTEIESVLEEHPAVRRAVIHIGTDARGQSRVIVYLVVVRDALLSAEQARAYAASRLPRQMVPSAFVFVDELPLLPNGKLDRTALPEPTSTHACYEGPRTRTQAQVASMWEDLLGTRPIGIHDNFMELGGHSLLAVQFIFAVRAAFGVEIALRSLFERPTVAEFAAVIDAAPKTVPRSATFGSTPETQPPDVITLESTGDNPLSRVRQ